MQCLYLNVSGERTIPLDLLQELACRKGFRLGYCHSSEDTFWQDEIQIGTYVSRNRPHEHLPKIWNDALNELTIDISGNPARRELIEDVRLGKPRGECGMARKHYNSFPRNCCFRFRMRCRNRHCRVEPYFWGLVR